MPLFQTRLIKTKNGELECVRIQGKSDGKNNSHVDGVWVLKANYDYLVSQNLDTTDLFAYPEDAIYFIKRFPKKKPQEAFGEMFLGILINKLFEQGFIEEKYRSSFSPAEPVQIGTEHGQCANDDWCLFQQFDREGQPLFKLPNSTQKQKSVVSEVLNRLLFNQRYEYLTESSAKQLGLSAIICYMVLFGNYSLHSGNILATLKDGVLFLRAIDYGAAFKKILNEATIADDRQIWDSCEEVEKTFNLYKRYTSFYKRIPNLLESAVVKARNLKHNISSDTSCKTLFEKIICDSLEEAFKTYKQYCFSISKEGEVHIWREQIARLLLYLGISETTSNPVFKNALDKRTSARTVASIDDSESLDEDRSILDELKKAMIDIIHKRLNKMSAWTRKAKQIPSGEAYFSKQSDSQLLKAVNSSTVQGAVDHDMSVSGLLELSYEDDDEAYRKEEPEQFGEDFLNLIFADIVESEELRDSTTEERPSSSGRTKLMGYYTHNDAEEKLAEYYAEIEEFCGIVNSGATIARKKSITSYVKHSKEGLLELFKKLIEEFKTKNNTVALVELLSDIYRVELGKKIKNSDLEAIIEGYRSERHPYLNAFRCGLIPGHTNNYIELIELCKTAIKEITGATEEELSSEVDCSGIASELAALLQATPTRDSFSSKKQTPEKIPQPREVRPDSLRTSIAPSGPFRPECFDDVSKNPDDSRTSFRDSFRGSMRLSGYRGSFLYSPLAKMTSGGSNHSLISGISVIPETSQKEQEILNNLDESGVSTPRSTG